MENKTINLRIFLLLLIISVAHFSTAQSFIRKIATTEDEVCWGALENPQGGYILHIQRGQYSDNDPGRFHHRDIFLKLDSQANLIDSLEFSDSDTAWFCVQKTLKWNNEIIITGLLFDPLVYGRSIGFRIIRIDYSLNILSDALFTLQDSYVNPGTPYINHYGNLVFVCTLTDKITASVKYSIIEMDTYGAIVKQVTYPSILPQQAVVELPSLPGYHICDVSCIVAIDEELNFRSTIYQHQQSDARLVDQMGHRPINDSAYIMKGQFGEPLPPGAGFYYDCGYAVFDKNGVWETQHRFGRPYSNDYPQGFDFISTETIYFSVLNFDDVTGSGDNQLGLYSLSINGTEHWNRWFGGYGFIRPGAVLATSDSSCLLIGNYWDFHNKPSAEYDVVIMKLNRDGTITGINKPEEAPTNVTVYPNPGESNISISGKVSGCLLSLYDNTGRLVLQKKLVTNHETIDTASLPAGFYTYRVTGSGSVVTTGKWVKL